MPHFNCSRTYQLSVEHMSIYQTIKDLRHSNKPVEAWNTGYDVLQVEPYSMPLKQSLFWACYDGIKAIQENIKNRQNKAPNKQEQQDIATWISCVEALNLPIPCDLLDYRFFNLFKDNGEHYEAFVTFLLKHHEKLFLWPNDYTPYKGGKHEAPSQALKQARVAAKGWLIHRADWNVDIKVLLRFINMVDTKALDQNKAWLHYDYAKCLIASRSYEAARDFVIPIVRAKSSEFWAWGALASTYIQSEPIKAITCFAKGLSGCKEAKYSVKMRATLADLLAKQGEQAKASALLCSIVDIYSKEGWRLKPEYEDLIAQPWFDASLAATINLDQFFNTAGEQANGFLYDQTTTKTGVVSSIHKSGKGFDVYFSEDFKIPVRKSVYTANPKPLAGEWVSVTYADTTDGKTVLEASPTQQVDLQGVETEIEELRVNPKGFAFVGNTFVPPHLIAPDMHGVEVKILKTWDMNPKKKEMTWRAIKVSKLAE